MHQVVRTRSTLRAAVVVAVMLTLESLASAGPGRLRIGLIDNAGGRYAAGCACSLQLRSAKPASTVYVFLAEVANPETNRAWMRIDGEIVELALVSSSPHSWQDRKGTRHSETYRSGEISVRVDYVLTKPSLPGEELALYAATITVTKAARRATVRAVGECGC